MKKILLTLFLIITPYCLPQTKQIPKEKEVRFILKDSTLFDKDYTHSSKKLGFSMSDGLRYYQYANMRGEVLEVNGNYNSYKILLENGDTVYSRYLDSRNYFRLGKYLFIMSDFYFVEDYIKANSWVNKLVYLNNRFNSGYELITDDKKIITLEKYERLKVIKVVPQNMGISEVFSPFSILVKKDNGETGYLAYEQLTPKNEIGKFSKRIQRLIKDGKIFIGMTKEQVVLSWGEPDDINKSVGPWGVHEQWVYNSSYLYFENERLTSYQN
jgi:hypothetical protein